MHYTLAFRFVQRLSLGLAGVVFALAGFYSQPAAADETASRMAGDSILASTEAWANIGPAVELVLGFTVRFEVVERATKSPFIGAVSPRGTCFLIVNKNPASWQAWHAFRKQGGLSEVDSYYFAMLHELGHCVNQLHPPLKNNILPPGADSELFADIFALIYAREILDRSRFQMLAQGVIRSRLGFDHVHGESSHSTGRQLDVVYQQLQDLPGFLEKNDSIGQVSREMFQQVKYRNAP